MSQIEELQSRMTAALERISAGVTAVTQQASAQAAAPDTVPDTVPDPAAQELAQKLAEQEKAAAELQSSSDRAQKRIRELKEKNARLRNEHAAEIEALNAQADTRVQEAAATARAEAQAPDEDATKAAVQTAVETAVSDALETARAEHEAALAQAVETARDHARAEALQEAQQEAAQKASEQEPETEAPQDPALMEALEEEKLANAQLEERVKRLKSRHADAIAVLEAKLAEANPEQDSSDATAPLKDEITALKQLVEKVTGERDALRGEQEVAPDVAGLQAELDTARAQLADLPAIDALKAELDAAKAVAEDTSELDALKAELEDTRAKLDGAEELNALRSEIEGTADAMPEVEILKQDLETLRSENTVQADALGQLDGDLQRLREANEKLNEASQALREANSENVGEPHLINRAMLAELEGLRALQATEVSTAGAVLSRLEPLLASAANLPEGEAE